MRLLKQSTARNVSIFMTDSTDHVTGKTGLTLTITESKDGAAFASITPTVTELANGWYSLALTTTHTNTLGDLLLHITSTGADPTDLSCHVVAMDFADSVRLGLTALPNAAAEAAGGLYTRGSGSGQINQPANGQVDVNAVKMSGTALTARDIGANVLLSSGTGTGQLDFTSGVVKSNLAQILGTALTETAGQIAAAFKKWFDVGTPTGTVNSIPNAVAGAAGGLFIAGTNAATTITTALTTTFTGNLTGSVASVTAGVTLAAAAVQAVWDAATSALTTTGSIGKWIVGFLTGDVYARLGAPAGASHAADIAAVKSVIGAPVGASVSADIAAVKTNVLAIPTNPLLASSYTAPDNADILLIKAKTDNLPASPAATSDIPTANITAIKAKTDNLPSDPASESLIIAATNSIKTDVDAIPTNPLLTSDARLNHLDADISSRLATIGYTAPDNSDVAAIKAKTDQLGFTGSNVNANAQVVSDKTGYVLSSGQLTIKKNVALANFEFLMTDSTSHDPATGLTVSVFRSIDGGAFVACTNAATEVSGGVYKINLSAADLNGAVVMLNFTAAGADPRYVTIVTQA